MKRRPSRTWVASAMSDAVLWTTATHSRFVAATTATTSGGEATTSSGARSTSYSNGCYAAEGSGGSGPKDVPSTFLITSTSVLPIRYR